MKARLITIATLLLFAGSAFANTNSDAAVTMTVDDAAPIRATLLPQVSVDATSTTSERNPATMRVADTEPMQITLLPTVHVTARQAAEVAIVVLPTVRVTASAGTALESMEIADTDAALPALPVIDDASPTIDNAPPGLRARTMPR
ncbi:MAG TPA: hypothetical protein VKB52_08535 [Rhodanobacteraceae bacterium]|nr:hypothetical protein [Rhodanobacteraceae bacterium]